MNNKNIEKTLEEFRVNSIDDFDFYLGLAILLIAFNKPVSGFLCLSLAMLCLFKRYLYKKSIKKGIE